MIKPPSCSAVYHFIKEGLKRRGGFNFNHNDFEAITVLDYTFMQDKWTPSISGFIVSNNKIDNKFNTMKSPDFLYSNGMWRSLYGMIELHWTGKKIDLTVNMQKEIVKIVKLGWDYVEQVEAERKEAWINKSFFRRNKRRIVKFITG